MARYSRLSDKNFLQVLDKIKQQYLNGNSSVKAQFIQSVDDMLEDLRDNDFFGTEGQLDPRGNGREL